MSTHLQRIGKPAALAALTATLTFSGALSAGTQYGGQGGTAQESTGGKSAGETSGTSAEATGRHGAGSAGEQAARQGTQGPMARLPDGYKLSSWIGSNVHNLAGDALGTIEELVMDDYGRLRYVVMKTDLRSGDDRGELVAVPMGHFQYRTRREPHLVLNVSPARMRGAPSFHRSEYPNMGRHTWSSYVIGYWSPQGQEQQEAAKQRATGEQQVAGQQQATGKQQVATQQEAGAQAQPRQARAETARDVEFDPNRDMVYLPEEKEKLFEKLDANDNAVIEPEEADANERLARQFERIDTFNNNRITRSEFAMFEIQEEAEQGRAPEKEQSGQTRQ